MKTFACVVLLVAAAVAEPPRYREERFRGQRQEQAPYPAAGLRPHTELSLPARQQLQPPAASYGVPADSYAGPVNTYSAPDEQYGAPRPEGRDSEAEGRAIEDEGKGKRDEGKEEASEVVEGGESKGRLQEDAGVVRGQGAYYVLLPGARLQRVQFSTENDARNMAYTARLRYSAADQAPLYVYTAAAPAGPAAPAATAYLQLY